MKSVIKKNNGKRILYNLKLVWSRSFNDIMSFIFTLQNAIDSQFLNAYLTSRMTKIFSWRLAKFSVTFIIDGGRPELPFVDILNSSFYFELISNANIR